MKTHVYANEIVDDLCRSGNYRAILFTTLGDASTPGAFVQQNGAGYAPVTLTTSNMDEADEGSAGNSAIIAFTSSGADWPNTNVGAGIQRTSGTVLVHFAPFATAKKVDPGETLKFDPGDFIVTEA